MAEEMIKDVTQSWALCLDTTLLPGEGDWWVQKVYASSYSDTGDLRSIESRYRSLLQREPKAPILLNNLGVVLWRQGKSPLSELTKALAIDSLNPMLYYNIGMSTYLTDSGQARWNLKRARELDNYSLRIKEVYNVEYRRFAQENDIPVADLENALAGFPEKECFVDHCHPTEIGHKLLAERLFRSVEQLLSR
jgi:predicted Zn-dependent protease